MTPVPAWKLRASFARRLSDMYSNEVPAYGLLVEVASEVNRDVIARSGQAAQRLGSIERVTAERHGAIRVGTVEELRQVARIFAAVGMEPVGYYDLRDAADSAVPVVSTAFRPIDADELARNPFRVFTSLLVTDDRRFFDPDLQRRLETFLAGRTLFPPELLRLADRAASDGALDGAEAERFLELATAAFALSSEPVDRAWYDELEAVSGVAADIGGVTSTHINHLTPRVLDIDELYTRMQARGITMIDEIQGPPRRDGCDVLLRQTSFRALAEPRRFRDADGRVYTSSLRVRFGEVEARGIALTPTGRARYDEMVLETDRRLATERTAVRQDVARAVWDKWMPATETELAQQDLAFFRYRSTDRPADGRRPPQELSALVEAGWVEPEPIVYEDFLPRSAAGIFQSNLAAEGAKDTSRAGSARDIAWMSGVLDRQVHDPMALYAAERDRSLRVVEKQLGLPAVPTTAPEVSTNPQQQERP